MAVSELVRKQEIERPKKMAVGNRKVRNLSDQEIKKKERIQRKECETSVC